METKMAEAKINSKIYIFLLKKSTSLTYNTMKT